MIKTPLSTMIGGAGIWTPGCTVIGAFGTKKTLNQLIKSIFANNEQGFVYDPNDLRTMFQDAAGTIPVTGVGQPVGLMLDKSKELVLGGELQPSGNLIGFSSGQQQVVTTDTQFTTATSGHGVAKMLFIVGKWYVVSVSGSSTASITINTSDSVNPMSRTQFRVGFGTCIIRADKPFLYLRNDAAGTTNITSISVRELSGNHAYQTTSSMRPLLVASPQRLDFDTVDDKLITTLPAQLTGCTVVRSVPNVGTQILTGQTIPTTYNDNTDHCGLIVINRALTAIETSLITKLYNKAAGV